MVKAKRTIRMLVAQVVAIATNIVPIGLWFFDDLSAEAAMIVYTLEAAAAVVFSVLCVLIVSPDSDPENTGKYKKKSRLIGDFAVIAGMMIGVLAIFVCAFVFLILKASIATSALLSAFVIVLIFQFAEFIADVLTLAPLPLQKAEFFLSRSMGRSALLFVAVFVGMLLAALVNEWFVVPFVVLKLIADIGEPIQFFLGKGEANVPLAALRSSDR